MRNFKLTSLALLLMGGVILNSCSKDNGGGDNPNNPAGQSLSADYQHKIVFTTNRAIGEEISIDYDAPTLKERDNVWVDFNNNGIREEGEFSPEGGGVGLKTISSQTITIYGKVTKLNFFDDNEITSIDTSKDIYLEELRIRESPIKTLDLTHNPNIKNIHVTYEFIEENIKGGLQSLSISADKNPKLEAIEISTEGMKTLDISNFPKLNHFLLGAHGSIENLKITNNPNIDLTYTFMRAIKIKNLEVRNNAKLNSLDISSADNIESIDVSDSPDLEDLSIAVDDDKVKNLASHKIKLLNTPKLERLLIIGMGIKPFDVSFCVQVDAHRVNNLPKDWSKSIYVKDHKQRTTINYQSTPCP